MNNFVLTKNRLLLPVLILPFLLLVISSSCRQKTFEKPGMPLIFLDFNGHINNNGLLNVSITGDGNVSYADGIADSCLDLSVTSNYRKPVIIEKNPINNLTDYPGATFLLWTKASEADPYEYFIFGQKDYFEEMGFRGWSIGKSVHGAWNFWLSDGVNSVNYSPTVQRQPINDGNWHLIGFSIDYAHKEARLFYDGENVAVISLDNLDLTSTGAPFYLGGDPLASDPLMDTYNGKIDEVGIWPRVLTAEQVASVYAEHLPVKSNKSVKKTVEINVLTWNIWLGGRREGRFVGVNRIAEIIRESGADIVSVQEMFGSGELLADQLGFYYYQRSSGIGVLSRYPIGKTYNVFKSQNIGAVSVELPGNKQLVFCPVWLNYLPNTRAYVTSGMAEPDTIVAREMETRGAEMRFILWELQSLNNNKNLAPIILAGDFNSGSHLDWTERNKANNFGLVVEFPVSKFIQEAGFIDSYREFFPDETQNRGLTWPLNFKDGFQDRTDFIYYAGSGIENISSRIIDTWQYSFPSDHAAVVSTFRIK